MSGNLLKEKRLEKNMTLEQVGNLVGVGKSTVRKWENGMIENMGRDKIVALSKALDISPLDILGVEKETTTSSITTIYNQLVPPRQEIVYNFAEKQLEEQQKETILDFPKKEKIPTVHNSACAANPSELAYCDTVVEEEEFERVPSNADFAVPIVGDSMEPVIRNGQFVFVKEQPDVEDGEIAIVELDGDGVTCKEIYKDYKNKTIILHSINKLYEDRIVSPEQIRIIGKVVF